MPTRLQIPKLAASPVAPLQSNPKFLNDLLQKQQATWPQDILYLRDTYEEIFQVWNQELDDQSLYRETEPKLEELVVGLKDVSQQRSRRVDIYKAAERAGYDAQVAQMYAASGDFAMATIFQSYAIVRVHRMLETMTREGRPMKASFLRKKGYGYDVSGEVQEGAGTNGDQTHLYDTAQPQDGHTTPKPSVNKSVDTEAEKQFPELAQKKHNKVHFPPRLD